MRSSLAKHIVQRLSSKRVRQIEIRVPYPDYLPTSFIPDIQTLAAGLCGTRMSLKGWGLSNEQLVPMCHAASLDAFATITTQCFTSITT